jgi:hypothetical protein
MADAGLIGYYFTAPTVGGQTTYPEAKRYVVAGSNWINEGSWTRVNTALNQNTLFTIPFGYNSAGSINNTVERDGTLSGTVTVGGSPVANIRVVLLYRWPISILDIQYTDASGNYSFANLDTTLTNSYAVVFLDAQGGTLYNDIISSHLTPV